MSQDRNKKFECTVCKKQFQKEYLLKVHMRRHTGERPYVCQLCKIGFSDRSYLRQHLNSHSKEKSFSCDYEGCKFTTLWLTSIRRHMSVHRPKGNVPKDEDNIYECTVCKKKFRQKAYLQNHMLRHTDERPYVCELCSKRYANSFTLRNHLNSHSRKKLFSCDYEGCKFTTLWLSNIEQHMSVHHPKGNVSKQQRKELKSVFPKWHTSIFYFLLVRGINTLIMLFCIATILFFTEMGVFSVEKCIKKLDFFSNVTFFVLYFKLSRFHNSQLQSQRLLSEV
ncbi:gastrula zinc finger protein XlCGF8.2DB-like [Centruroides sculpturatus]|uniref:gastrula zinc finger protein XlCGF8.2DB-like n=1 Tax=Centruroides sculpturatus TaxID=218467 RepID=UPI000C6E137B|nr:gastrula zinc finger protein XlCGF8.2DB-like [Centruroides sculpturatus]